MSLMNTPDFKSEKSFNSFYEKNSSRQQNLQPNQREFDFATYLITQGGKYLGETDKTRKENLKTDLLGNVSRNSKKLLSMQYFKALDASVSGFRWNAYRDRFDGQGDKKSRRLFFALEHAFYLLVQGVIEKQSNDTPIITWPIYEEGSLFRKFEYTPNNTNQLTVTSL